MTNAPTSEPNVEIAEPSAVDSPLAAMVRNTPSRLFNDSCNAAELKYAIDRGATGATSNPVICLTVLKQESDTWQPVIAELAATNPRWSETQIAWELYRRMGAAGAAVLKPTFDANGQTWGRLSIQTDPSLYRNSDAMLQQSVELSELAPNMQVKMPCTSAGVAMIEEATFRGVNLNVTVSFSVPQVMAIAEAIERGLVRRDGAGLDTSHMAPVATMMVGRLDDWLKVIAARESLPIEVAHLDWAGIACAKRAYELFVERGFRTKFLVAAYRHLGHWSELVGGDVVHTMPHEWQVKANRSGLFPNNSMSTPVNQEIMKTLKSIPEFMRAYEPNGMTVEEFNTFGPTVRTLRSFIQAWHDFVGIVRETMLPNPD
jgi:transaldolase